MKRTSQYSEDSSDGRKLSPHVNSELCYATVLQRGSSLGSSISTDLNENARQTKRQCTYPAGVPTAKKPVDFPSKLMDILLTQTEPNSIFFLPEGEAIALNKVSFTENVLQKYFNGMKWNSAVRNFNRWGFRRISHPSLKKDEIGFHHLLFRRDAPHLVHRMKRDCDAQEVMRQLELGSEQKEAQPATAATVSDHAQTSGAASLSPVETSSAVGILRASQSLPSPLQLLRGFSPSLELREGSQREQERQVMLQLLDTHQRRQQQLQQLEAQQQYDARNPFRQFQGGHHWRPGDK